ncbi:MAG: AzlC family ABC transporter permease [Chloroflexota bacterium]
MLLSLRIPRNFVVGARDMVLVAVGVSVYGMVFGRLSEQAGLTLVQSMGMSLITYSGAAQFVALPLLQSGASLATITLAVLVMSLRHVVMGLSLAPALREQPLFRRLLLAYAINDETYAVVSARAAREGFQPAYMAGAGLVTALAWVAGTWLGFALGQFLPSPESLGLDFAFTALFIALVVPQIKGAGGLIAMLVAGGVSIALTPFLGLGLAIAVSGVLGALLGGWFER